MKMRKLKVAVGLNGKFVFLEKFRDTELNNQLVDLQNDGDVTEKPGLYRAKLGYEIDTCYGEPDEYILVIKDLTPLKL